MTEDTTPHAPPENGLQSPALPVAPDSSQDRGHIPPPAPHWLIRLVHQLRMLLLRLAIRMMPPQLTLFELATGGIVAQMLQQAIQLNIADRLDAGPMTAAELGTELNLRSDELHRMLRACSSAGVFSLDSAGRFSNNYLSRAMRSRVSGTFRDTVDYFTSPEINEVWTELPNTLRTGQGGYEQLHGCSVWEWYAQNPAAEARFARSMMGLSALDAQGIASARPFRQIKKLGDLGGGAGLILSEILRRNPQLQGVLLDAEGVLHIAQQLLTKRGVAERAELQPGSFFQDVPNGCDGLFLKNILHDWDDADVRTILGNCRSGLPVGGKLLLVEMLHEPNTPNRVSSISDVQMMMATARGRERSEAELASLLKEQGFELTRIHPLPGFQSLIEATAQPPAAAH